MSYWKSQQFTVLQATWYSRLEAEGFKDAEIIVGDNYVLRQTSAHPYKGKDALSRAIKEYYWALLAQQVNDAEFESDVDELILTLYADGQKIKTICEALERRGTKRCRETVRFTVRKYEMKWGVRRYTPRQLNQKAG